MDLLKLSRFFVTIVEEAHFGHAARRLGMTQPPLSQGLQRLESGLGVRLLDRGAQGLRLTDAGAAVLPHAHQLLRAEGDLRQAAIAHSADRTRFRLGLVPQLPARLTAALASVCSGALPGTSISVQTAPTTAVVEAVATGRFDVGVIVHPAVLSTLDGGDVVRLPTTLLVPQRQRPPQASSPRLRELLRLPLAVPPRSHSPAAHDLLVDTLQQHGVNATTATVDDERSALALVAVGQACALTADPSLSAGGVLRLPVPGDVLPLRVRVVWRSRPQMQLPDGLGSALTAALLAESDRSRP